MRYAVITIVSVLFLFVAPSGASLAWQADDDYAIWLGYGKTTTPAGTLTGPSMGDRHCLIQFHEIPDARRRLRLRQSGIVLHRYVGGNAYLASIEPEAQAVVATTAGVRAVLRLTPELKIEAGLQKILNVRSDYLNEKERSFYVRFHTDVQFSSARETLALVGVFTDAQDYNYNNSLTVRCAWPQVEWLLYRDEVEAVDIAPGAPVMHDYLMNDRMRIAQVREKARFERADGESITIGLWDFVVTGHVELGERVHVIERNYFGIGHGNFCAGLIVGTGNGDPRAKGIVPAATLYAFDPFNVSCDYFQEVKDSVESYGVFISSNSWSSQNGWLYSSGQKKFFYNYPTLYGAYDSASFDQDKMAFDTNILLFRSAGNDRSWGHLGTYYLRDSTWYANTLFIAGEPQEDLIPPTQEFGCLGALSTSKNIVVVGATMPDDTVTWYSSWGPSDDGRIKPDLVTVSEGTFAIWDTGQYTDGGGTSASCPIAAGTAALLADYYYREYGRMISPDMLKALLIHCARDVGRPGPDYSTGFGMPDAELGAMVVQKAAFSVAEGEGGDVAAPGKKRKLTSFMLEGSVDHKEVDTYDIDLPSGRSELRATVVWRDPPGKRLVNNIDMWIEASGGTTYRPFVLDPENPEAPATTGINKRDNVEHILVRNPAGGSIRVFVQGANVPQGPQPYSIIVSAGNGNIAPKKRTEGELKLVDMVISKSPLPEDSLDGVAGVKRLTAHDVFYLGAAVRILDNAKYYEDINGWGEFWGTVDFQFLIKNAKGERVFKYNLGSYGYYPRKEPWVARCYRTAQIEIPGTLPKGEYAYELIITMHNGASDRGEYRFTVY